MCGIECWKVTRGFVFAIEGQVPSIEGVSPGQVLGPATATPFLRDGPETQRVRDPKPAHAPVGQEVTTTSGTEGIGRQLPNFYPRPRTKHPRGKPTHGQSTLAVERGAHVTRTNATA